MSRLLETLPLLCVGTRANVPCGISDYAKLLATDLQNLESKAEAPSASLRFEVMSMDAEAAVEWCRVHRHQKAVLLCHYERSHFPENLWEPLIASPRQHAVFVIPHEVYAENPFAFPYHQVKSKWPGLTWVKRARYRLRHRDWFAELSLQARGYGACAVFPLTQYAMSLLHERCPQCDLTAIPLGSRPQMKVMQNFSPFAEQKETLHVAIHGFLNPGLDYALAFRALAKCAGVILHVLGTYRSGPLTLEAVKALADEQGVADRVLWEGGLSAHDLAGRLQAYDGFLCPFRFKSTSASLLDVLATGRRVAAATLPITLETRAYGGDLELFEGEEDLVAILQRWKAQKATGEGYAPHTTYAYSIETVAKLYGEAIRRRLAALRFMD